MDCLYGVDFHIGGYAEFQLSEVVSFQPELLYSREGSAENDFFDQRLRLQLNFVQIPILFKFHVSDEVNVHIGPQTGFLVAQKFKSDGNTAKIEEDVFSTVVLSAAGGAGFDINENMEAGGRYVLGLTNWRTDVSDDVGGPRETGHVIQFYFSYKLR
ncbi:MAG: porin family protein [Cyclobacteriaceae bacterium]